MLPKGGTLLGTSRAALRGNDAVASPAALTVKARKVAPDGEWVRFARSPGIRFGDA